LSFLINHDLGSQHKVELPLYPVLFSNHSDSLESYLSQYSVRGVLSFVRLAKCCLNTAMLEWMLKNTSLMVSLFILPDFLTFVSKLIGSGVLQDITKDGLLELLISLGFGTNSCKYVDEVRSHIFQTLICACKVHTNPAKAMVNSKLVQS
jgi:hypothetical protein